MYSLTSIVRSTKHVNLRKPNRGVSPFIWLSVLDGSFNSINLLQTTSARLVIAWDDYQLSHQHQHDSLTDNHHSLISRLHANTCRKKYCSCSIFFITLNSINDSSWRHCYLWSFNCNSLHLSIEIFRQPEMQFYFGV